MITTLVIAILVGLLIWWVWDGPDISPARTAQISENTPIEVTNPRHVGWLTGMMGGSIQDAVTTQFALRRFEEQQGRKVTFRDAAMVIEIMRSLK